MDKPTTSPTPSRKKPKERAHLVGPTLLVAVLLATLFTTVQPGNLSLGDLSQQIQRMLTPRPAGGNAVVFTPEPPKRIGIVAGHLGHDSGAVCEDEDGNPTLTEQDMNYEIALLVEESLTGKGFEVELLKEYDTRLSGYNGVALVSIHNDSCEYVNDQATGFKVAAAMDTRDVSRANRLTACLVDRYQRVTGMTYHAGSITGDMTQYHTFSEISPNTVAAIIETGFLYLDRDFLTTHTDQVAEGIVQGILCFVNNESVESTPVPSIP
jgi:N-acetylmuramoyl-L-alanine amidase